MENTLRNIVLFVWSVLFGFFSLTAYLDDTMASAQKIMIVVGLLLVLAAYIGMELYTRKKTAPSPLSKVRPPVPTDERILRRLQASASAGGSAEPSSHLNPRPATVPTTKH